MAELRHLGQTQQALLRHMLQQPEGIGVEALCERLRISHNAVRQHLNTLLVKGWVERMPPRPTGGRPEARFRLTAEAHALFPRNYAQIAGALMQGVIARLGDDGARELLVALGQDLGAAEPVPDPQLPREDVAAALAKRMDEVGYEAVATQRGGEAQVEAYNCVFHALARAHPDVCRFDVAFMEAASGHRIHHMECIVRGGHVCRFRIGEVKAKG
ncbi:helix-turn-helix transcriptional regulator [Lysobacter solisilvae (ex Woo and Kim 2022)]|uniref:MarR family transcriptional regulator n=1 Tax=Agrilutibacter terrestris TaxID=2865112 RepID=A0A7H0G083_9GAMM|nr:helix-turn-helix domain-containing protein [Lysobacter terrestris]QNP41699.1 MarR family transcriptional regulator [Lysobacter terrestris]